MGEEEEPYVCTRILLSHHAQMHIQALNKIALVLRYEGKVAT